MEVTKKTLKTRNCERGLPMRSGTKNLKCDSGICFHHKLFFSPFCMAYEM